MAYDGNTQFSEDSAHTSTDKGTEILAVRNDTRGALAGTDQDYSPLQVNASGDLRVDGSAVTQPVSLATNTPTLQSGSTTAVTQATAANLNATVVPGNATGSAIPAAAMPQGISDGTNLQMVRQAASTFNGSGAGVPISGTFGVFDDVSPTAITENNFGALRMSANRNLYGTIRDAAGNERGVNVTASNALTVDGSAVIQPISAASLPLPSTAATSTKQSDGTQKTQVVDGAGNVIGATSNALDVNIKSGASSGTQYDEDTASTAADKLTMAGVVRKDTAASLVDTDGDRSQLQVDASGRLHVNGSGVTQPVSLATNTPTLQSGSTTAVTQATAANLNAQVVGDVAAAATDSGNPVKAGYVYASSPATYTTGQRGNIHGDSRGGIYVISKSPDGTTRGQVGSPTDALTTAAGVYAVAETMVYNGTNWDMRRGNTTGASSIGGLAHDVTDTTANQPVKTGGQARTTNPTAVADADVSNFIADKLGKQVTVGSIRELKGRQRTVITASTAETTIVTAVAATFLDVYRLVIANTSATACQVDIRDATAGSIVDTLEVPANGTVGWSGPESSAANQSTVNNNWTATCGTSVSSIIITAYYVKNT